MIQSAFSISKQSVSGLLLLAAFGFVSCSIDKTADVPDTEESSEYIRVGAEMRANIATRSPKDSGPVESGEFVLTYPYSPKIIAGDINICNLLRSIGP